MARAGCAFNYAPLTGIQTGPSGARRDLPDQRQPGDPAGRGGGRISRTAVQATELDNLLGSESHCLEAVPELRAPDSELELRVRQRANEQGRKDDTVEVFRRRLELYHRETHEVVGVYAGRGILVSVDGSGHPGAITARAIAAVEKFLAEGVTP